MANVLVASESLENRSLGLGSVVGGLVPTWSPSRWVGGHWVGGGPVGESVYF